MGRATLSRRNRYPFATAVVYSIAHPTDCRWTVKGRIQTIAKNVADLLVDVLVEAGVRHVYGVSGDSLNGITNSIRTNKQIKWIHVRHEGTAAFAAGAEAHLTGRLAVCAGSCGPGNLHLINGLCDCHRSRVPVLAIAARFQAMKSGADIFRRTVAELASNVGLSRTGFAVRLAKVAGIAPLGYVRKCRMLKAGELLRQGKDNVEEIAMRIGYESGAAFSQAFKGEIGVAPGQNRRASAPLNVR